MLVPLVAAPIPVQITTGIRTTFRSIASLTAGTTWRSP
jgi:hypothetical protein